MYWALFRKRIQHRNKHGIEDTPRPPRRGDSILYKNLSSAKVTRDKELYRRQIAATDKQIDALVYELYKLTPEEIKIVEAGC